MHTYIIKVLDYYGYTTIYKGVRWYNIYVDDNGEQLTNIATIELSNIKVHVNFRKIEILKERNQ